MNICFYGDCRETMKRLISEGVKVQMCVTSPPYWGLRDYGHPDQLGLERTPEEYVQHMVEVFSLVRELLNEDGTLWVNFGDSYSSHKDCKQVSQSLSIGTNSEQACVIEKGRSVTRDTKMLKSVGLKNKDLVGIPWRVAFALQADGWYLRSDIIWSKPNPMPESVTDRPTKAHEYLFLLSKSQRYYFDQEAVREPHLYPDITHTSKIKSEGQINAFMGHAPTNLGRCGNNPDGRNIRSVWTIPTQPTPEAHFATFPEALITPCIKAGTSEKVAVLSVVLCGRE